VPDVPPATPDGADGGPVDTRIRRGTPEFRRLTAAIFAAGLATFAVVYTTQPLLPVLSRELHVSPATSSLTLGVTTATLALSLLPALWLSEAWGRTRVMSASLVASGLLGLLAAAAPSFEALLVVRALQGISVAGIAGVTMGYLAEEVHPSSLGTAIGLYLAGNGIGGMVGRLLGGGLADAFDWRAALLGIGVLSLTCSSVFLLRRPPSTRFVARPFRARESLDGIVRQFREPGLVRLNVIGVLMMGAFLAIFNGMTFRLAAAPYGLGEAALGAVFLVYALGSSSSALAGRAADVVGRRAVLPAAVLVVVAGMALTLARPLGLVVVGIAVVTIGFFATHSVCSSWVGRRALRNPGQASAVYVLCTYVGSSVFGPLGGAAWSWRAWDGVALLAGVLVLLTLVMALQLRRTPPRAPLDVTPAVVAPPG